MDDFQPHPTQMIPNTAGSWRHCRAHGRNCQGIPHGKLCCSGLEVGIRQQRMASSLLISAQQRAKPSYFVLKKKTNNKNERNDRHQRKMHLIETTRVTPSFIIHISPLYKNNPGGCAKLGAAPRVPRCAPKNSTKKPQPKPKAGAAGRRFCEPGAPQPWAGGAGSSRCSERFVPFHSKIL